MTSNGMIMFSLIVGVGLFLQLNMDSHFLDTVSPLRVFTG